MKWIVYIIVLLILFSPVNAGFDDVVQYYSMVVTRFFLTVSGQATQSPGDYDESSYAATSATSGQGGPPGSSGPIGECDLDYDGYLNPSCGGNDCDDSKSYVHPGAPEVCDNLDNDCDGQTDEGVLNICLVPAGPGQTCSSYQTCGLCSLLPPESGNSLCNDERDNDCDGLIDCSDNGCFSSSSCSTAPQQCNDNDDDSYYRQSNCGTLVDCNDNNQNINPGATEIPCDGIDQDCSGSDLCSLTQPPLPPPNCVAQDSDGDGVTTCSNPIDCNDNDPDISPQISEICNDAKDNNCNGNVDEGCQGGCYYDGDNDGFNACQDCDDSNLNVFPGSPGCGLSTGPAQTQVLQQAPIQGTYLTDEQKQQIIERLNSIEITAFQIEKILKDMEGNPTFVDAGVLAGGLRQQAKNLKNTIIENQVSEEDVMRAINLMERQQKYLKTVVGKL